MTFLFPTSMIDWTWTSLGANMATTSQIIMLPMAALVVGTILLVYLWMFLVFVNTDHTILSLLKMNYTRKPRPPVAPFGMFECIHNMTSDQQPWFPLRARKALNDTDTFVLPLPRRPVMTGDFALAREILTDPLSMKPRVYQEFEPLGVGSIFTRNGPYWVSTHTRWNGTAVPAIWNGNGNDRHQWYHPWYHHSQTKLIEFFFSFSNGLISTFVEKEPPPPFPTDT